MFQINVILLLVKFILLFFQLCFQFRYLSRKGIRLIIQLLLLLLQFSYDMPEGFELFFILLEAFYSPMCRWRYGRFNLHIIIIVVQGAFDEFLNLCIIVLVGDALGTLFKRPSQPSYRHPHLQH